MQKFQSYRFDVMTKGSGDARMQPLYFLITTAGTDTNSICYETHQKAKDILERSVCYGGLDLSSTTDITAFVMVFPPMDEDDKYVILPYFWIPEETLELRVRRDHVPYDVWEQQSWDLTVQSDAGMSIRSLYMITVAFCLYDFRIFPLKSGILLRELSLKLLNFPLFYGMI